MAGPRFSVVVPTYNGAARLRGTLDSVLRQTLPAQEVIVVDDGSTDDTPAVCAGYGTAIRTLRIPNGGQQAARNRGVALARGGWIAFLDHDDLWDEAYLERVAGAVGMAEIDMVFCNARTADAQGGALSVRIEDRFRQLAPPGFWEAMGVTPGPVPSILPRYDYGRYLVFHPAQPSIIAVRRDFHLGIGGFDPRMRGNNAENVEFELRALLSARVGLVWQPSATLVEHAANTGGDRARTAMDMLACLQFAARHHALDTAQAAALEAAIAQRVPNAIHGAFTARRFDRLRDYAAMGVPGLDLRARVKLAIARLPHPLARGLAAALER